MLLKWEPIYSVNVKELDNQHKKIFTIINNVLEIKKDYSKNKAVKAIKELKDYGNYHQSDHPRNHAGGDVQPCGSGIYPVFWCFELDSIFPRRDFYGGGLFGSCHN